MKEWGRRIALLVALLAVSVTGIAHAAKEGSEQQKFVAQVEKTLNGRDASFFDRHVDFDVMIDKALSGIEAKKELKDAFTKGAKGKSKELTLGKQILDTMGDGGSYRFLHFIRQGTEERALFRLLQDGGGVNYHGLLLGKNKKGELVISDFYNFMSGEPLTETLRRTFITAIAGLQQGSVVSMFTKEGDFVRSLPKIKEMQAFGEQKKFREALKVYDGLPATLQKDKGLLLLKIIYAAEIDDKEYEEGMDLYKKNFPNDPSIDLVTLDSLVLKKRYAEAVQTIGRLDRSVGGDPYLGVLRANMYMLDGNNSAAKKWAAKTVKEEPTLIDGYWVLVSVSLAEKNYKETARLLSAIENDLGVGLADLETIDEYAGFVKSPEYDKWMQGRK